MAKRLLFAVTPTVVLLALVTAGLTALQSLGIVIQSRDDAAAYGTVMVIKRHRSLSGDEWVLLPGEFSVGARVPVRKEPNTVRILITGGSFAMGTPYVNQHHKVRGHGGVGDWVRAELAWRFPSHHFELVNAALGGQNSMAVHAAVGRLFTLEPDLLIVGTGNNEGYLPPTFFNEPLRRWVVYRALKTALIPEPEAWERPVFTPQDDVATGIMRQYRENVAGIAALARGHRVPLVLMALPINYRYRGLNDHYPTNDPHVAEGMRLTESGDCAGAAEAFARSPNTPMAAKLTGYCFDRSGDSARALEFYRTYVENLPLNRTRPSMNQFVRTLDDPPAVVVADLERAAMDAAPDGITPSGLFLDYCHMTWRGYHLMAQTLVDRILEKGLVTGEPGEPRPRPTIDELIMAEGWQDLYRVDPGDRS